MHSKNRCKTLFSLNCAVEKWFFEQLLYEKPSGYDKIPQNKTFFSQPSKFILTSLVHPHIRITHITPPQQQPTIVSAQRACRSRPTSTPSPPLRPAAAPLPNHRCHASPDRPTTCPRRHQAHGRSQDFAH